MNLQVESAELVAARSGTVNRPTKSRIYVSPAGESVMENFLGGRHNRPVEAYRAFLKPFLAPGTRLRWSKHAGCKMCPCSPGFIVEGRPLLVDRGGWRQIANLHVTVKAV